MQSSDILLTSKGTLSNSWGYFWFPRLGGRRAVLSSSTRVEARDASKYLTKPRIVSSQKKKKKRIIQSNVRLC